MGTVKGTDKSGRATKVVSQVKGGWVTREVVSGRLVEVGSDKGTYRAKPESEAAIEKASKDRYEALKRLANR
jgi:hypothetical protein